jgi:flagellar basal-body rod protein FlgF
VGDLVQSASAILSGSQRRAEDAAHNISNMATPGYRAKHSFAETLSAADGDVESRTQQIQRMSLESGQLSATGAPTDLAIDGEGFFELRSETGVFYTRNGQFTRGADGRLLGLGGLALQGVGGGDIVLPEGEVAIGADGTITQADRVLARIAVATFAATDARPSADGLISAQPASVTAVEAPTIRQGFLESSNVSLGDEMIALMEAVRRAETGQRLMNVYDDLLGRVITTFGQNS